MQHENDRQFSSGTVSQQSNMPVPPALSAAILKRLELFSSYASSAELLADLHHPEWYVRAAAVQRLSEEQEPGMLKWLGEALRDQHEGVRLAAVQTLRGTTEAAALAELISALQDTAWQVREAAALALGSCGGVSVPLEPLIVALSDADSMVRDAAANTLVQTHPEVAPSDVAVSTRYAHQSVLDVAMQKSIELTAPSERMTSLSRKALKVCTHLLVRCWSVFRCQIAVIPRNIWMLTAVVILLAGGITLGAEAHGKIQPMVALVLMLLVSGASATGTAFLYGDRNDAGLELTLAAPTSIRFVLSCRVLLVIGYNCMLALVLSMLLAMVRGGSIWEMVQLWLGPLLLLSAISLALSTVISSLFAAFAAIALEIVRVTAINTNCNDCMLQFVPNQALPTNLSILVWALCILALVIFSAPRLPRLLA